MDSTEPFVRASLILTMSLLALTSRVSPSTIFTTVLVKHASPVQVFLTNSSFLTSSFPEKRVPVANRPKIG